MLSLQRQKQTGDCFPISSLKSSLSLIHLLITGWSTDGLDDLEELTVNPGCSPGVPRRRFVNQVNLWIPIKTPLHTKQMTRL